MFASPRLFSSLLPFTSVSEVPIHSFTEIFHRSPPMSYIWGRRAFESEQAPRSAFILFCRDLQIISAHWAHQSGHWHAEKIGLWWRCFVVNWQRVAGFVDERRCGWKRRVIWADPCMCVTAASSEAQCVVLCMVEKAGDGALYELLWHFYHLWWSLKKTQMFSSNKPMNFSLWVVTQKCIMNEWMHEVFIEHFYCVLLYTQSTLQSWWGLSWTTTSVQHPLGWCDACHRTTAPVCSPHTTSPQVERMGLLRENSAN